MKNKNNICLKSCKNLEYIEDKIYGEVEEWGCIDCDRFYNIPINIERDFERKEEIKNENKNL